MSWIRKKLNQSIGLKFIMALTGLMLLGFLLVHLMGNLSVFAGREALNGYAQKLHSLGGLLWIARIMLIGIFLLHVRTGMKLTFLNKEARPIPYFKKTYLKTCFTSRTMAITGLMILAYLIFHLSHYTFKIVGGDFSGLEEHDVYGMIIQGFSVGWVSFLYILTMILLGFHLYHGLGSTAQTLGINHPKYNCFISKLGKGLAIVITLGYISIPLAVITGLIR